MALWSLVDRHVVDRDAGHCRESPGAGCSWPVAEKMGLESVRGERGPAVSYGTAMLRLSADRFVSMRGAVLAAVVTGEGIAVRSVGVG